MSYDPMDDEAFQPGLLTARGDGSTWPTLIDNDAALYELYTPGLEATPEQNDTALERLYRFRVRGNLDDEQIQVKVRAEATSGPHDIDLSTGITTTVNVTGDAWYDADLDATGPIQEVLVAVPAIGAGSMRVQSIRARVLASAPLAGNLYASGFRLVGARWKAANAAISTGQLSRLVTNPIRVAKDRPVCIAFHLADCVAAVSGKSSALWGVEDSTQWLLAGAMKVPRADSAMRQYTIDAYVVESGTGAEYSVRLGPTEETWTGTGWHSWTVTVLGPGPHELQASILPGAGKQASIRTCQVWRM